MTKARNTIVNVNDTPYYHCMGRCVRRAFICGMDEVTGKDYSHRKQWIVDRLGELSHVFLIDVCAYAIMSNHYHVVLKINHDKVNELSEEDVIYRWMSLFSGHVLVHRYIKKECKTDSEIDKAKEIIDQWRERLADLSWFMRCLNETISRKANEEDGCTGHFWEGRFKSQALLNEQALLSCMAYVDLNPIRAGIADSLDESEFTSIEQRVKEKVVSRESLVYSQKQKKEKQESKPIKLADFVGGRDIDGIPYLLMDYLELVDWTGKAIIPHSPMGVSLANRQFTFKKGFILEKEPEIIEKLGLSTEVWLQSVRQFSDHLYSHIGSPEQLKSVCQDSGKKWLAGIKHSRQFYQ